MRPVLRAVLVLLAAAPAAFAADAGVSDPANADAATQAPAVVPQAPPEEDAAAALSGRERYNLALASLAAGDAEGAAEDFLAARDAASADPELRYRSAFNLGVAFAARADALEADAPEAAIETLRSSVAWFNDAVRSAPPDDDDARINLEVVLRRIQQLADQLNRDDGLEARLDRIIDDQRGLRDGLRGLVAEIEAQGAGAEPIGFQTRFDELATRERTLLAEASNVADLAAAELAHIAGQGPDAIAPEQQIRAAQLDRLGGYLQRARQSMSDTRNRLRRLEGERAHRRADAALNELKRAREQLLDPVAVLKAVAGDERLLLAHTELLAMSAQGALRIDAEAPAAVPGWLTGRHLANRQEDAAARTGEVAGRFDAVLQAQAPVEEAPADRRLRQAVTEAAPLVREALAAMRRVLDALGAERYPEALRGEVEAATALARAIERFAGLRDLIELTYADQARVVSILVEPLPPDADSHALADTVAAVAAGNAERLMRLEALLRDELPAEAADDPEAAEAVVAARERFEAAEALRREALASVSALGEAVVSAGSLRPAAQLPDAQAALEHLAALRRLFFSIVEHLKALGADQAATRDQTATLQFDATVGSLQEGLGLAAERQTVHAGLGDALAGALAEQADAAGAAVANEPGGGPGAEQFAQAATEVRSAAGRMASAGAQLGAAVELAASASPELEPALEDQLAALEHIENAIRLLQPPNPDGDPEQSPQQQNAPQPAPAADAQPQQQMSQRQALRRLQAIRDREAQRQREREGQATQRDPVEKDW